jgi:hypothetical protein
VWLLRIDVASRVSLLAFLLTFPHSTTCPACSGVRPRCVVETAVDSTAATTASDVYVVGGLAYELLTGGTAPFHWLATDIAAALNLGKRRAVLSRPYAWIVIRGSWCLCCVMQLLQAPPWTSWPCWAAGLSNVIQDAVGVAFVDAPDVFLGSLRGLLTGIGVGAAAALCIERQLVSVFGWLFMPTLSDLGVNEL